MADPKADSNPVTVGFIDTTLTVSQRKPVTSANPLPVTLTAGSDIVGKVGIDQTTPGTTNAVQEIPGTSGGLSRSYASLANSNNATVVKASAGQVYHIAAFNNGSTIAYLKFYNQTGSPSPGLDTVVHKVMIPGATGGSGVIENIPLGLPFSAGIAYAVVTGFGDTDNTSVAASTYSVTIGYK